MYSENDIKILQLRQIEKEEKENVDPASMLLLTLPSNLNFVLNIIGSILHIYSYFI